MYIKETAHLHTGLPVTLSSVCDLYLCLYYVKG